MAPVPNLDLMKKGLRRYGHIRNNQGYVRSKPRPDEEGIETCSMSCSRQSWLVSVPNLDLMKKGLRPYCSEQLIDSLYVLRSKPRPDEEGIETLL